MSVLNCPVCQGTMQEVNKSGVAIDVCTVCRGVWLDRGELEKLSALIEGGGGGGPRSQGRFLPERDRPDSGQFAEQRDWRRRDDDDDDDDDDRRGRRGGLFGQGGRRRSSLLDFFD